MLEKLIELARRDHAKNEALREIRIQYEAAKREIEEEFGDTDAAVREEKKSVMQWMLDNDFKAHIEPDGMVELRDSAPKYDVKDERGLIAFLAETEQWDALDFKKREVNSLKKSQLINDELVSVRVEKELALTTTYKKE